PRKLHSDIGLESDIAMEKIKEKPKSGKTEETAEEEETVSPKAKQIRKKAEPSEKEEPSQDGISPKTKSLRKKKEPIEKDAVSSKTKKVTKNEEPSEKEIHASKPKKMKKEKEKHGETAEKSPKLKNQFPHSESWASEERNSEIEQEILVELKDGAFSNFPLPEETIQLLKDQGVTFLFLIQAKTFHRGYSGKDLTAQAQVGTGTIFSFAIPLIEKLHGGLQDQKRGCPPQVLVRVPIRQLANQVSKDFSDITKKLPVACFYAGTPYGGQFEHMRNGIDILVGTSGRIKVHIRNGKLGLTKLKRVVLDEVDQMLDMGFADQVKEILSAAYKKDSEGNPQTLLPSAACPHWVFNIAKKYMKSTYEQVDLIGKKTQKTAVTVEHLAIKLYSGYQGCTIIFCKTKKEAQELSQNLAKKQDIQLLHRDIPQKQREITQKGFRNGSFGVLVAINVAEHPLDIPEVDLVVESSPPKDVESYIHLSEWMARAGRTGQHKGEYQLEQVEQKARINKDATRLLDSVPLTAIRHLKQSVEKLIEEKKAGETLAAALTHISVKCQILVYAWKELKEHLGEKTDSKVKGMVFPKGKLGVCFDVPTASVTEIQEKWHDSRHWQRSVATEQPELEGPWEEYGGFRGQRDGNRRIRGQQEGRQQPGGGNESNRSQNKGPEWSFSKAFGQ
uniref:RNA helicase n=1 Tax=Saimiri boliviensis boliviensis TaxID=39432 RepID=A0A2K6TFD7_SAIBB